MKTKELFLLVSGSWLLVTLISGCATAPRKESLNTYKMHGTTYIPLITLCERKQIGWEYDTFTRAVTLTKDSHRINLMVGEKLVMVDGRQVHLREPIEIYQGVVVAPAKFKEEIIDNLFKGTSVTGKAALPISRIKKVVIDAGHGGHDPGAIGRSGLREKDVNLDVAKRISRLLRSCGIEVVMTRDTDRFISLGRRADIANSSGADLFVSIHSNANRVRKLNGLEVYYLSPSANDSKRALSSAKSARLNFDSSCFASNSQDLKAILWDMIYTNSRGQSIELSSSICKIVRNNLDTKILGVKGARFQVLRDTRMPAVLVEIGFLSNPDEERMLKNNYYRQKIAEVIVGGIQDYCRSANLVEMTKR